MEGNGERFAMKGREEPKWRDAVGREVEMAPLLWHVQFGLGI